MKDAVQAIEAFIRPYGSTELYRESTVPRELSQKFFANENECYLEVVGGDRYEIIVKFGAGFRWNELVVRIGYSIDGVHGDTDIWYKHGHLANGEVCYNNNRESHTGRDPWYFASVWEDGLYFRTCDTAEDSATAAGDEPNIPLIKVTVERGTLTGEGSPKLNDRTVWKFDKYSGELNASAELKQADHVNNKRFKPASGRLGEPIVFMFRYASRTHLDMHGINRSDSASTIPVHSANVTVGQHSRTPLSKRPARHDDAGAVDDGAPPPKRMALPDTHDVDNDEPLPAPDEAFKAGQTTPRADEQAKAERRADLLRRRALVDRERKVAEREVKVAEREAKALANENALIDRELKELTDKE